MLAWFRAYVYFHLFAPTKFVSGVDMTSGPMDRVPGPVKVYAGQVDWPVTSSSGCSPFPERQLLFPFFEMNAVAVGPQNITVWCARY